MKNRNKAKSKKIIICKICKMAAILNFANHFFSKSNQFMRVPYYTYISSYVKIRQAVHEIDHPQTIYIRNQANQANWPKENLTTFFKYCFCIMTLYSVSKVYVKQFKRYMVICWRRRRRTGPVAIPPFRIPYGRGIINHIPFLGS